MRYQPVFLSTDVLIFILLAVMIFFAFYTRKREHLMEPWRKVAKSKLAMASLAVLMTLVSIGALDSIHFRERLNGDGPNGEKHYSGELVSLFDIIIFPLGQQDEKTYSSPFATHLFVKEVIQLEDGTEIRDYPRLKYAGVDLDDTRADKLIDIVARLIYSLALSLVVWFILMFAITRIASLKKRIKYSNYLKSIMSSDGDFPMKTLMLTIGTIIFLFSIGIIFSNEYHIFGTNKIGQDVFYETLKSIRTGLVIGTLTTLVMLPFAVLLGIMAGYFGGWIDDVIQYLYTTLSSIPGVLLIAASILSLQIYISNHPGMFNTLAERADIRLLGLCFILGITSWTGLCRMLRGETLKLREMEYVQAAHALGVKQFRILIRHLLPNVLHIVLITIVLDFSALVLAEAVLTYVGVGVDPTTMSWGNMINSARLELAREPVVWWPLLAAFLFMFALVLSANLFSDAVRDAFDPRRN